MLQQQPGLLDLVAALLRCVAMLLASHPKTDYRHKSQQAPTPVAPPRYL